MAAEQGMSGIDVLAMVSELRELLPLWVGKIYQYDTKTLGVRLNGEGHARHHLMLEAGRRAHLTASLPEPPKNPPMFAMFLRKYINGGRVLDIRQYGLQRIFIIDIGKRDTTYHLVTELFGEGNVILCDEDFMIIKPLWHHRFKDREVVPGARYEFSGDDTLLPSPEQVSEILKSSERDLVRTLAVDFMLGGQYAEWVCRRAGIDKNRPAPEAETDAVYGALTTLLDAVQHRMEPVITTAGCAPSATGGADVIHRFDSFNEALDAYYTKQRAAAVQKREVAVVPKDELIRRRQLDAIAKFEERAESLAKITELIYANYVPVDRVITTLRNASTTRSWQEIRQTLVESRDPGAKRILEVYPEEAAVDIDLGERVKIFIHQSVEENVNYYYGLIKRLKKKRQGALAALKTPLPPQAPAKVQAGMQKRKWFHRFRWFYTSDGVLVLGGRDASQNEDLVKRYLEGGDTFVHADVHGGSVVIVKGQTECMDEVAQFAASYSNAWKAGHFTADVYAAEPEQVSKTPPTGEYVARGAFIVRGERRYFRNTPLGVAIGIQTEPVLAVIGGPPAPVAKRTEIRVELSPGRYEPNDMAKKIVRLLRERLGESRAGVLKKILNTENVAAFVPAGGSEITGCYES